MSFDDDREQIPVGTVTWEPMTPDPPWHEADHALRRIARRRAGLEVEEARWLLAAERTGVHVHLGMGSFSEYVERILGYRPRTTFDRLRVATALEQLPATRAALAAGLVSYSVVRELTRIVQPATEQDWLTAVDGRTIREVESMVAGHSPGDLPDGPVDLRLEARRLLLRLRPETHALFLEARQRLGSLHGTPLSDDEVIAALCERTLAESATDGGAHPPFQVALTVCAQCEHGWQHGGGHAVDVSPEVTEMAECDATVLDLRDDPITTTEIVPPKERARLLRRAVGRCRVPGCRAGRNLQVHELKARGAGEPFVTSRRIVLCGAHHRAVHHGTLQVTHSGDDDLTFAHADGRPYGSTAASVRPSQRGEGAPVASSPRGRSRRGAVSP